MPKIPLARITESRLERDIVAGSMQRFAKRVERTLRAAEALPRRKRDRWIIGTLAALEHHSTLLLRALRAFAPANVRGAAGRTFEDRLIDLVAQLDAVYDFARALRGPLHRSLERRCGPEGLATACLRSASSSIKGLASSAEK